MIRKYEALYFGDINNCTIYYYLLCVGNFANDVTILKPIIDLEPIDCKCTPGNKISNTDIIPLRIWGNIIIRFNNIDSYCNNIWVITLHSWRSLEIRSFKSPQVNKGQEVKFMTTVCCCRYRPHGTPEGKTGTDFFTSSITMSNSYLFIIALKYEFLNDLTRNDKLEAQNYLQSFPYRKGCHPSFPLSNKMRTTNTLTISY